MSNIITKPEDIKSCLEELVKESPEDVTKYLNRGDKVRKGSGGIYYIIDDPEIYKKLLKNPDEVPPGAVPYRAIHDKLNVEYEGETRRLFKDNKVINFSEAFNKGMGECCEKAILVQLAAQKGRLSFFINGILERIDKTTGYHSFNIVFKDEKPYLVDAQIPLKIEENEVIIPYITPVKGIDIEDYGRIILPEEWNDGRKYFLK